MPRVSPGDTFRCGDVLVSEYSSASEIVSKCGAPTNKTVSEVQPTVRNKNGALVRLPMVRTEVWTFDLGKGSLPMRVTLVDGKVKAVEIAK
jgi:Protein of unknown function (DUF2845)